MAAQGNSQLARYVLLMAVIWAAAAPVTAGATALDVQADQLAQAHLAKFGHGYRAYVDHSRHLVYISALDRGHLQETVNLLAVYCDAQRKTLFRRPLPWNVTIVLPTAEDYAPLAPAKNVTGFYQPAKCELISIDRGRVLLHEFTHALHHADAASASQVHPIWIMEGLATLFEAADVTPGGITPHVDTRLITLHKAIRTKTTIPLARLCRMDHKAFSSNASDALLAYAQARYLMLYLYQRGQLGRWYEAYKSTYGKDASGVVALEKVLGKRVFLIEDEWTKWAASLEMPWGELRSGRARLGAVVKNDSRGAKVVSFVPGSPAQRSGQLKIGDIIREFNGHKVRNSGEFVGAVQAAGANQTVTIKLLRHGRQMTVRQPLSSPTSSTDALSGLGRSSGPAEAQPGRTRASGTGAPAR